MLRQTHSLSLWIIWLLTVASVCTGLPNSRSFWGHYAELVHFAQGARHHLHQSLFQSRFSGDHIYSQTLDRRATEQDLHQGSVRSLQQTAQGSEYKNDRHLGRHTSAAAGDTPADGTIASGNTTDKDILHRLHTAWPEGYVAVCAVVKDQNKDLRYWLEYHRWLGVSKFYIYDNNSTLPAMFALWDYIQQGIVDYQYFKGRPRKRPDFRDTNQYKAYSGCLLQHFKQHRWLAFIDIDEFFVFPPENAAAMAATSQQAGPDSEDTGDENTRDLLDATGIVSADNDLGTAQPGRSSNTEQRQSSRHLTARPHPLGADTDTDDSSSDEIAATGDAAAVPGSNSGRSRQHLAVFLSSHEQHAAIGINWVLFGSSQLQDRPRGGPLAAFTSCVPQEHWESTHVKVIANTGGVLGVGPTPHEIIPRAGRSIVDIDGVPFKGPKTQTSKWHKLIIHHYVLKSRTEFAAKNARGSGAGNVKDWAFFDYMDGLSNHTCTWGQPVSKAFLASRPRLRPPRGAKSLCGMRTKMQLEAATAAAGGSGDLDAALLPVEGLHDQQ